MIPRYKYEGIEDFGLDIIWRYVLFDNITSARPGCPLTYNSLHNNARRETMANTTKFGEYSILYFGSGNVSAAIRS